MSGSAPTAGFSLIEVLIVLVIVASLATLAALSLRPQDDRTPADSLPRLLAEARSAAILSGAPIVVTVDADTAQWTERETRLAGRLLVGGERAPMPYRVLAYPDGSYSGGFLSIERDRTVIAVPGVYRDGSR